MTWNLRIVADWNTALAWQDRSGMTLHSRPHTGGALVDSLQMSKTINCGGCGSVNPKRRLVES